MDESITNARDAARKLLEAQMQARLEAVEALVASQDAEDALLAQLAEVRAQHQREWAEAERLGWSRQELRRLKLRPPHTTAERAPRLRRSRGGDSASGATTPAAPPATAKPSAEPDTSASGGMPTVSPGTPMTDAAPSPLGV
ncbi:hypothetical protein ACSNOI_29865 [Actinomadura kijaniata]|uniref:hypothetical protein n=1 Tax=Actinomadura kijaniata TaxID=46161 RepID=UPI003F1C548E